MRYIIPIKYRFVKLLPQKSVTQRGHDKRQHMKVYQNSARALSPGNKLCSSSQSGKIERGVQKMNDTEKRLRIYRALTTNPEWIEIL